MHNTRKHSRKSSVYTQPKNIGLLLGAISLAAGTAWCLKNHFGTSQRGLGNSSRFFKNSSPLLSTSSRFLSSRRPSVTGSDYRNWLLAALGAILAGTALYAKKQKTRKTAARYQGSDVKLTSHVTIRRAPEEVYQYWKNFKNLPRVMSFIERVEPQEGNIYHWVAKGPAGPTIEWDAKVINDIPGKLLAWRSLEGSDIQTWGTVTFSRQEDNRGTDLYVDFNFTPPANATSAITKFMAGLESTFLEKNLKDLKSQIEAGDPPSIRHGTAGNEPPTTKEKQP